MTVLSKQVIKDSR